MQRQTRWLQRQMQDTLTPDSASPFANFTFLQEMQLNISWWGHLEFAPWEEGDYTVFPLPVAHLSLALVVSPPIIWGPQMQRYRPHITFGIPMCLAYSREMVAQLCYFPFKSIVDMDTAQWGPFSCKKGTQHPNLLCNMVQYMYNFVASVNKNIFIPWQQI